ncbi:MAG: transglycosylase SLT domain-containing protein [Casimicrobiaceae bacterium]
MEQYAKLQELDPALVKAVIAVESSFQPNAAPVKGTIGLMQIIPETGERYGIVGDATRSFEQKLRDHALCHEPTRRSRTPAAASALLDPPGAAAECGRIDCACNKS